MSERNKDKSILRFEANTPVEQVLIASANAIDLEGYLRHGDEGQPIFDAGWVDDDKRKFILREVRDEDQFSKRMYQLDVYAHEDEPKACEYYLYNSVDKRIQVYDRDRQKIKMNRYARRAAAAKLIGYLGTASEQDDEQNEEFERLMMAATEKEPGLIPLARRIGDKVMKGLK